MSPIERELLTHAKALRQLARDLVGPADAEDLVQETALRALRSPPARAGGLGGFFATILRRLASSHRRDGRRRVAREQAAARAEAEPATAETLARGEMLQRLTAALMALPMAYREVLLQRYFEDRKPAAIAERAGVPVATVKTRLQRGLGLLREQLDGDGEGGEWRALLVGAFGLEQAAAVAAGVLVMGTGVKLAIGGAAAVVAVAATLWLWRGDPVASSALPRADAAPVAAVAADIGIDQAQPQAPQLDRREVVTAPAPSPAADLVTVRGRCVDAANGAPLAGASVSLKIYPPDNGKGRELAPARITGDDGSFELRFRPDSGRVQVEFRAERRMRRLAYLGELPTGKVVDLGDIPMLDGARVHGRTLDDRGRPVPKCSVALRNLPIDVRNPRSGGLTFARSGEDGSFTFDDPVPPGTWGLEAGRRDMVQVDSESISVQISGTDVDVTVHLAALPSITGSVCDESGRPVAGAHIQPSLASRYRSADSKPDGTFELFALEPSQQPQQLEATATGYEIARRNDPIPWGSRDVHFVLRRGVPISIEVVERSTQIPVCEYAIKAYNQGLTLPMARAEKGRRTLEGVQRGRHSIAILPKDEMLLMSSLEVDVQDETPRLHFEVERLRPQRVEVRDASGQPLAGAMVEVLHLADSPVFDSRPFDYRRSWPDIDPQFTPRTNPFGARYLTATTDSDGVASVGVPDNDARLGVRAGGAGASPRLLRQPTLTPGRPLTITLEASPTLRGALHVVGYPAGAAAVAIDMGPNVPMREIAIDTDGTFAAADLASGQYALHFAVNHVPLAPALQQVTLRSGETTAVELDASRFDACSLKGRIVLDGRGMPGVKVELLLLVPGRRNAFTLGPFVADADGRFTAPGLPPGEGTLQLPVDSNGMERRLRCEEPLLLEAGEALEREFDFLRRRLLVHAHDDQGRALADRCIHATWPDGSYCTATTGTDGIAEFDWMSAGKVVLSQKRDALHSMRGEPAEGTEVEVPATARETKVDMLMQ